MKRIVLFLTYLSVFVALRSAEPYCNATLFDEESGLSQHSVKQIDRDCDGLIWIATWNGLNRFDGYVFECVRPGIEDSTRRYSSRFRDIKCGVGRILWCRIDDKIVSLDLTTNKFVDIHSLLENRFGVKFDVNALMQNTARDTIVVKCKNGLFITIPDSNPVESAVLSESLPQLVRHSNVNRKVGQLPDFLSQRLAYGFVTDEGYVWVITTDGVVAFAEKRGETMKIVTNLDIKDKSIRYCTTDTYGNLWLRCSRGAYRLSLGVLPYSRIPSLNTDSKVLQMARDCRNRIWVAESGAKSIAVYDDVDSFPRYLSSDGRLLSENTNFGHTAYSLLPATDETMWIGTKPDGLYRLTPRISDSYSVEHIIDGNIYDMVYGPDSTLWVATLRNGVVRIENPSSSKPQVTYLNELSGYPDMADNCRKLMFENDTTLQVATTGGLFTVNLKTDGKTPSSFRLHSTEVDNGASLGCVATMDILPLDDGRLLVATESDGVNVRDKDGLFSAYSISDNHALDLAQSLSTADSGRNVVVTASRSIYSMDMTDGKISFYGESFWHSDIQFTDSRLLPLPDGRWLAGTESGAIVFDLTERGNINAATPHLMFTRASIQGRPDTLLTSSTSFLRLGKTERNVTLRFAAVNHPYPEDLRYTFRIDGGDWTDLKSTRVITLYDLKPRKYNIEVCSFDLSGRSNRNFANLTLDVTPRFYETLTARIIFAILILAAIGGMIRLYLYVRAIKRKQKEMLEIYMRHVGTAESQIKATEPHPKPEMTDVDKEFMNKVMAYVNSHLSDTESNVDDMAIAIGVSRSGLARKMRSSIGVSAAEFLRRTRLEHAAKLLLSTDLSVKEIAYECGFTDINYFSKSFKSYYSASPTAYRQAGQ